MRTSHVGDGIVRITVPLPFGIDHVHCYALRTSGGWTVVDTGLGVDTARAEWQAALAALDDRVERIVITHFHPDHVGAAAVVAELTGAPVFQGVEDYEQCVRTWGRAASRDVLVGYMVEHGLPPRDAHQMGSESVTLSSLVKFARGPLPLHEGDDVDGWRVVHLPGHADGHLCLLRDGILVAGDALLATISPNVGLYPESRPDPLGDYLGSLERIAELSPHVAFAGHGPTVENPQGRARELIAHHRERLAATCDAVDTSPRTAYDVSLRLFPDDLAPVQRRFALAESRAHLEYLALRGDINRIEAGGITRYVR